MLRSVWITIAGWLELMWHCCVKRAYDRMVLLFLPPLVCFHRSSHLHESQQLCGCVCACVYVCVCVGGGSIANKPPRLSPWGEHYDVGAAELRLIAERWPSHGEFLKQQIRFEAATLNWTHRPSDSQSEPSCAEEARNKKLRFMATLLRSSVERKR